MDFNTILNYLNLKYKNNISIKDDKQIVWVDPVCWLDFASFLKGDKKLSFNYLMCLSSYDVADGKTYGIAYNFFSTKIKHYLEIRIEVEDGMKIPSVSNLWRTADWHEREAYDMMGVQFQDHPNHRRILLSDDWDGHPLRKDYKEPDYYHGMPVPKDKTYWE